jgi:hypothetical protein
MGCDQQPAGERALGLQGCGALPQEQEDGLCDVLGQMYVAHLTHGGGVDEVNVLGDDLLEGGLGAGLDVVGKQIGIGGCGGHCR